MRAAINKLIIDCDQLAVQLDEEVQLHQHPFLTLTRFYNVVKYLYILEKDSPLKAT